MKIFFLSLFITFISVSYGCDVLRISAHSNYPPYHWFDGKEFKGATVESIKKIFKDKPVDIKFIHFGPWKRVLLNAKEGEVDLILGLKNSSDRKSYMKFTTEPFFENPFAVFAKSNVLTSYTGIDDLRDKKGLFNLGDRYGDEFDSFLVKNLNETRVKNIRQAYTLLLEKRFDYYVTGFYTGTHFLLTEPQFKEITFHKPFINKGFIYHGFSKKSPCLKYYDFLNDKLSKDRLNGASLRLIEKYKDFRFKIK